MTEHPTPDLDAIEARANAATDGPWAMWDGYGPTHDGLMGVTRFGPRSGESVIESGDGAPLYARREDWDFAACARMDVPALVAEVRRLRAKVAAVEADRDRLATALLGIGAKVLDPRQMVTEGPLIGRIKVAGWVESALTAPAAEATS